MVKENGEAEDGEAEDGHSDNIDDTNTEEYVFFAFLI